MKAFFDILRGVVIGLANIIPGVSGGTMMVSMGIYDTIIGCINSLFKDFKRCRGNDGYPGCERLDDADAAGLL